MSFEVVTTPNFDKEAKRLAKRWPSLKDDLVTLFNTLAKEPRTGIHLGRDVYKIRLRIASTGKGSSGGARVITVVKFVGNTVYPCSIYAKNEKDTVTEKEIKDLIGQLPPSA